MNPYIYAQFISCTIACIGFAIIFGVRGRKLISCGVGSFICFGIYVIVEHMTGSGFLGTMWASIFVAAFAQVMARVHKSPATIFQAVCSFPMIPGNNLYYTMYYVVMDESDLAKEQFVDLMLFCAAIALGFIVVEIANKYITIFYRMLRHRAYGRMNRY